MAWRFLALTLQAGPALGVADGIWAALGVALVIGGVLLVETGATR